MAQLAELCDSDAKDYQDNDLRYLENQGVIVNICQHTKRTDF